MAEQILPPDLMAILARAGMLGPGAGPGPQQQPQAQPQPSDMMTLAALARAGMLGPEAMGGQAQPMPPTLGGGENMPPSPMPQQGAPPQPQPMPPTLSGAENAAPPGPPRPGLGASMGSFLRGAVNPLGIPAPPPMTVQSPVATLTGREQNLTLPSTIDFNRGANADPTAEMVGSMVGVGPALNAAGRVAAPITRAAASQPTLAGILTAGGVTAATPGQTQTPSPVELAQRQLDQLMAQQTRLTKRQEDLTAESTRFDSLRETSQPSDDVRRVQEFLNARGASLTVDGLYKGRTRDAIRQFQQETRRALTTVSNELNTLAPNIQSAQQAIEEANRRAGVSAGSQRLRDVEANLPWYSRLMRDWSEPIAYAAGPVIGGLTRYGVVRHANRASADAARQAENLVISPPVDLPSRVGRANQFWARGQSGANAQDAFLRAPQAAYGFRANPNAPPAAELYRPPPGWRAPVTTDLPIMAGMGAEFALAEFQAHRARQELDAAQAAYDKDPNNEANIQRLQHAKDQVGLWQGLGVLGRMGAAGYGLTGLKVQRHPSRPDTYRAEAERIDIDQTLRGGPPAPRPNNPQPPPNPQSPQGAQQPVTGHWNFQPRNRGQFGGPPDYPDGDPRRGTRRRRTSSLEVPSMAEFLRG